MVADQWGLFLLSPRAVTQTSQFLIFPSLCNEAMIGGLTRRTPRRCDPTPYSSVQTDETFTDQGSAASAI